LPERKLKFFTVFKQNSAFFFYLWLVISHRKSFQKWNLQNDFPGLQQWQHVWRLTVLFMSLKQIRISSKISALTGLTIKVTTYWEFSRTLSIDPAFELYYYFYYIDKSFIQGYNFKFYINIFDIFRFLLLYTMCMTWFLKIMITCNCCVKLSRSGLRSFAQCKFAQSSLPNASLPDGQVRPMHIPVPPPTFFLLIFIRNVIRSAAGLG